MDTATAPTTAVATATATILALDLGKYKSVACAYDRATAQARFDTLTTSRDELRKLFESPAARPWSAAASPPRTASAPSWSARDCPPRAAPAPGPRPAWRGSASTPSPWPTAPPTSCGAACWGWP